MPDAPAEAIVADALALIEADPDAWTFSHSSRFGLLVRELADSGDSAALRILQTAISRRRGQSTGLADLDELAGEVETALASSRRALDVQLESEQRETLAGRILLALERGPMRPVQLAETLGVSVTQVSRGGRQLSLRGDIRIETEHTDGRARVYRLSQSTQSRPVASDVNFQLAAAVERMRLRKGQVHNDLVPNRVGDSLGRQQLSEVVSRVAEDVRNARHEIDHAHFVEVPKPSGGTRPAALLPMANRVLYTALVSSMAQDIEERMVGRSLVPWPRGVGAPRDTSAIDERIRREDCTYVHQVDIANFYSSVPHERIRAELSAANVDSVRVDYLIEWLYNVMQSPKGLPQGLQGSDPLATLCLSPLDRMLEAEGIRFIRYVDDIRVLVDSTAEAQQVEELITKQLRQLGLALNDEKSKTWKRDNYLARRMQVDGAVADYVSAVREDEGAATSSVVHRLLNAFDVEEDVHWGWYHGTLDAGDVIDAVGTAVGPGDGPAVLVLLHAATRQQHQMAALQAVTRSKRHDALRAFTLAALVASTPAVSEADLRTLLSWSEYTELISAYLRALAPKYPEIVSASLAGMWSDRFGSEAQWAEYFSALRAKPNDPRLIDLAQEIGVSGPGWLSSIEAALYLSAGRNFERIEVADVFDDCPEALRDDAVLVDSLWRGSVPSSAGTRSQIVRMAMQEMTQT